MWLDCRWQWMVNKDRLVYSYWTLSTEHPFALPHTNHPYNTHSNQNPHSLNHTKTYSSTPNVHCSEQCDVWLIFIQFLTMPFLNQCLKQFKSLHKQCIKRSTSPTPSKRVVPTSKIRRWSCNQKLEKLNHPDFAIPTSSVTSPSAYWGGCLRQLASQKNKLRRCVNRVHFAKIHFAKMHFGKIHFGM